MSKMLMKSSVLMSLMLCVFNIMGNGIGSSAVIREDDENSERYIQNITLPTGKFLVTCLREKTGRFAGQISCYGIKEGSEARLLEDGKLFEKFKKIYAKQLKLSH